MKLYLAISFAILLLIFIGALWLGGPAPLKALPNMNEPFMKVDFSSMPPLKTYQARDGVSLSYREYLPSSRQHIGSAVLVHGSSASSNSMHPMARALAAAGIHVYSLDIRGHGDSGKKGHIDYIGQLDSDMQAFVEAVQPVQPCALIGFSSGGGFVLRIAASEMQNSFDKFILLSPFLGPNAPNYKPNSGGWVSVGVPRIVALLALNAVGVKIWNHLTVTQFALSDQAKKFLTPEYDFNLAMNFSVHQNYQEDIRQAKGKVSLIAGELDEAFDTQALSGIVQKAEKNWPVYLLPSLGHIDLILKEEAFDKIIELIH